MTLRQKYTERPIPLLWPWIAKIFAIMFDHPLHMPLCPAHVLLFETTLGPFQPTLYVQTTATAVGASLEGNPYMQGGRCHQWILRPPAALLLALPAAARSCAIGALLVAQPLLDGVLVLAACDERAPSGSGRVAVVSFSLE